MSLGLGTLHAADELLDVVFHPTDAQLLAACGIDGRVSCFRFDTAARESGIHDEDGDSTNTGTAKISYRQVMDAAAHQASCRSLQFARDGQSLFSAGKDCVIRATDIVSGSNVDLCADAHAATVSRLLTLDETLIASGDEDGVVRVWDVRAPQKMVREYMEHEDFIADMAYCQNRRTLFTAGGDGYLSVFDLRKRELLARSDNMEEELLSVVIMKNGRKIVCGTQSGNIDIFSWGDYGDISDRFPGHPSSVDALCKLDEDTLCSGSNDGLIRVVNVLPNQFVGALGEHDGYPIERLALSADGNTLASCSHDCTVKLWDLAVVDDDDEDDAKEEEEEEEINEEPEEQSECSAGGRSEHDELDNELEEITGIANASINSTDTVGDSNDSDVTTALRTRKKPRKRKANDILPGTASATRNRFFDDLM